MITQLTTFEYQKEIGVLKFLCLLIDSSARSKQLILALHNSGFPSEFKETELGTHPFENNCTCRKTNYKSCLLVQTSNTSIRIIK